MKRAERAPKVDKKVPGTEGSTSKANKKDGSNYNYYAIGFMILFALPVLLTSYLFLTDYFFPESTKALILKNKVVKCYLAANPTKIGEVDKFLEKYKGRENILFANLKEKYYKIPECNLSA